MKKDIHPKKGYKVTDEKMQCRGYQYEIGKRYKHNGDVSPCYSGFHYCELAADCFGYYSFTSTNRVFEILDYGKSVTDGDKTCTSEIEFVRELTWEEVLKLVNTGKDNTGIKNSGDSNSGNRNSGNWNSGNSNSGNWNSGYRNSGDSNSGYRNDGAFCTDPNPTIRLFDKDTKILVRDWENMRACNLMYNLNPNIWVWSIEMTEAEKKAFPTHKTTGGYLKSIPYKEAWTNMWGNLSDADRKEFTSLPNFDSKKFEEITGIKTK